MSCKLLTLSTNGNYKVVANYVNAASFLFLVLLLRCNLLYSAETPGTVIINTDPQVTKYQIIQQAFENNFTGATFAVDLSNKQQNAATIKNILRRHSHQVIYAIGAQAYLAAYKAAEKNQKIIFSSSINWQRLPMTKNAYGIANELPPRMQLTMYRYLFPELKKIGVIYSADYNREWLSSAISASKEVGIEITPVEISNPSQLKPALNEILSAVDVLWLISDPLVLSSTDAAKLIFKQSHALKKPVFTYNKVFNQFGALLVISADIPTMGRQVANLAEKLLARQRLQNHVINPAGSHISLNMQKLHEYQLKLNYDALDSVNEIIE